MNNVIVDALIRKVSKNQLIFQHATFSDWSIIAVSNGYLTKSTIARSKKIEIRVQNRASNENMLFHCLMQSQKSPVFQNPHSQISIHEHACISISTSLWLDYNIELNGKLRKLKLKYYKNEGKRNLQIIEQCGEGYTGIWYM